MTCVYLSYCECKVTQFISNLQKYQIEIFFADARNVGKGVMTPFPKIENSSYISNVFNGFREM